MGVRPSWPGRVEATTGNIPKHPFMEPTGWLFQLDGLSNLNHHSGASRHPCYVGTGQGQSRFLVSNNDTAASKRIDTNVLSVAILLLQRYPY